MSELKSKSIADRIRELSQPVGDELSKQSTSELVDSMPDQMKATINPPPAHDPAILPGKERNVFIE